LTSPDEQRAAMVRNQLLARGVIDTAVLSAFRAVPRERFVAEGQQRRAYEDHPLPIGCGQTISQPYVVAFMAEAMELGPTNHVLEVGAGSGYAAAIFSRLARDVIAIERYPELSDAARGVLADLGYDNVRIVAGDGSLGFPDEAPYDAICVSAGAPDVPPALLEQLAPGGRLVLPVGDSDAQRLVRVRHGPDGNNRREDLGSVRFVPLVGEQGWQRGRRGRHHREP
jgi:protein-L-isoaspartate(D-aspartate) O-methyltransferase